MDTRVMTAQGFTVWLTGLPCSGKSTIAAELATLLAPSMPVEVLDGDQVRPVLSEGLGYSRRDRATNVRRIGFVAELLTRNGVAVIAAVISPHAAARAYVRERIGRFVEVHVRCPADACEQRDVKGMYKRARAGELVGFTGVDDPYEEPANPELVLDTLSEPADVCAWRVMEALLQLGFLQSSS